MLRSMTGYGRGEAESGGVHYLVQLKSVNNRFLEAPIKLPSSLWSKEAEARAMIQKALSRGKLDLHWKETRLSGEAAGVSVNLELGNAYLRAVEKLAAGLGMKSDVRLEQIARYPDVITGSTEADEETVEARWQGFKKALALALDDMQGAREREGQALGAEIQALLKSATTTVAAIEAKAIELVPLFAERLKKRIESVVTDLNKDDPRIVLEAALMADKADIREEIVRFRTHVTEFERVLASDEAAGKRLDFLSQELLREANTMGSKSPDAALTQRVVMLKSEIEKIKEQIQNLE